MLAAFGARLSVRAGDGCRHVTVEGHHELSAQPVAVPGDPSSAAFPPTPVPENSVAVPKISVAEMKFSVAEKKFISATEFLAAATAVTGFITHPGKL